MFEALLAIMVSFLAVGISVSTMLTVKQHLNLTTMSKKKTSLAQARSTSLDVLPREVFAENPSVDTALSAMSEVQQGLFNTAREALVSVEDAKGKFRRMALYIRQNHIALRDTECKLMIAAGFHKVDASKVKKIAIDTDLKTFQSFMDGLIPFNLGVEIARGNATLPPTPTSEDGEENQPEENPVKPQLGEIEKAKVSLIKSIENAVRRLEAFNALDHGGETNNFRYSYNKYLVQFTFSKKEAPRSETFNKESERA